MTLGELKVQLEQLKRALFPHLINETNLWFGLLDRQKTKWDQDVFEIVQL